MNNLQKSDLIICNKKSSFKGKIIETGNYKFVNYVYQSINEYDNCIILVIYSQNDLDIFNLYSHKLYEHFILIFINIKLYKKNYNMVNGQTIILFTL